MMRSRLSLLGVPPRPGAARLDPEPRARPRGSGDGPTRSPSGRSRRAAARRFMSGSGTRSPMSRSPRSLSDRCLIKSPRAGACTSRWRRSRAFTSWPPRASRGRRWRCRPDSASSSGQSSTHDRMRGFTSSTESSTTTCRKGRAPSARRDASRGRAHARRPSIRDPVLRRLQAVSTGYLKCPQRGLTLLPFGRRVPAFTTYRELPGEGRLRSWSLELDEAERFGVRPGPLVPIRGRSRDSRSRGGRHVAVGMHSLIVPPAVRESATIHEQGR